MKNFYEGIVGVDPAKLDKTIAAGYRALTAVSNNEIPNIRTFMLFSIAE